MVALRPSRSASSSDPAPRTSSLEAGFTLLELLIVMVIIAVLAAMAVPSYKQIILHAREAVLKEDLYVMRKAIDSYTVDKQKAPQSLDDLVTGGYIKAIPKDPFTNHNDSWTTTQSDTLDSVDQTAAGIDDVHSGAQLTASDGTSYNTW
jgi:general secretion pathway protein G